MPAYACSIYESIDEVDPVEWNRFHDPGGDVFMAPAYLRAVERAMRADSRFFYAVVRNDRSEPVAVACFCVYELDAVLLAGSFVRWMLKPLRKLLPGLLRVKILLCGHPVSVGASHLRMVADADAPAVLTALNDVAERLAAEHRAKCIVFKEFDSRECARLGSLENLGYRRADSLPMNVIDPQWSSFDEYVASVKSRKRSVLRRSIKKFDQSNLRVSQHVGGEGVDEIYTDDVHRLYDEVLARSKVKLERLPAEYFRELARQLPENSHFTFIRDGDRIVAFAASVFSDQRYHQLFVGFDEDLNPECDLYFNLFFREMDAAYRRGVKTVVAGQTSDVFKQQKLGSRPEPLFLYVKGCRFAARLLLRVAFRLLFPPRNPAATPNG